MKLPRKAYKVGWICALSETELPAAEGMLDGEQHEPLDRIPEDPNHYTLGRIGPHNVVITCLPPGAYGTNSAAKTAQNLRRSFPAINIRLMVGIGGGVLSRAYPEIRLGDVVVSQPMGTHGGVVQYDLGKVRDGKFKRVGQLQKPPSDLLGAVGALKSRHVRKEPEMRRYTDEMLEKNPDMLGAFGRPPADSDHMSYDTMVRAGLATPRTAARAAISPSNAPCRRKPRLDSNGEEDFSPAIWYGLIASGNLVVASAAEVDKIERNISLDGNICCFDMGAAGVIDDFPCIVIRGISNYADSQKKDLWQGYAAASAAAYAKELLCIIPPEAGAPDWTSLSQAERGALANEKIVRQPPRPTSFNLSGNPAKAGVGSSQQANVGSSMSDHC